MPPFIGCYCLGEPKASIRLLTGVKETAPTRLTSGSEGAAMRSALFEQIFVTVV